MELFVRVFLISHHRNIHFFWKDILHQPVNTTLTPTFPKKIISCNWPKILITDCPVDHKEYLNNVALRTIRYSWCLSTVGTTLLFTQSVNSTNITVHILQCFSVMNQCTLQNFGQIPLQHHSHTQDCISQTVLSDLKVAPVLMHSYICMYISYHQFTFRCLMCSAFERVGQYYPKRRPRGGVVAWKLRAIEGSGLIVIVYRGSPRTVERSHITMYLVYLLCSIYI
jgi:hypothetical protein